jgi:SAM-dependent methyltransferase
MEPEADRRKASSYYGPNSGFGLAIQALQDKGGPLNVAVIGLGTGTTAAYGRNGDLIRFYEINPQVVDLAQKHFRYLSDSAAKVEVALGDARLTLERERAPQFDLIAVDAFSGDSIPTHLLTIEALDAYFSRLKPEGVLVIHTTNRYLTLPPVIKVLAEHRQLQAGLIEHEPSEEESNMQQSDSDWVLVSRDRRILDSKAVAARIQPIKGRDGVNLWTDDYNNLFRILK